MQKILPALLVVLIAFPSVLLAQEGGSLVGSLGLGLTVAQGDFSDEVISDGVIGLAASSGFGMEAELRYYLFGGFSIGGNINYMRFGSSFESTSGRVSYNFNQMGGLAKMNILSVSDGKMYLTGGAGVFTPNAHFYVPSGSFNIAGEESGTYFFGGIGLISKTTRKALYELEARYNVGTTNFEIEGIQSDAWNFIYIGIKVSFSTKGLGSPPLY